MNYLAHIFLSGSNKKIQLGNFIGDAVKGNSYENYPQFIADGVLLHRTIDHYTDNHPLIKEAIQSLRPYFGRYSAVLLDIYFDYLLAVHFREYSRMPLKRYTKQFYWTIVRNYGYLPDRIKRFMWHFILTDRLSKYATINGIKDSLEIMVRVHRIDISIPIAIEYLKEHEKEMFNHPFTPFFAKLTTYCENYLKHSVPYILK